MIILSSQIPLFFSIAFQTKDFRNYSRQINKNKFNRFDFQLQTKQLARREKFSGKKSKSYFSNYMCDTDRHRMCLFSSVFPLLVLYVCV